MRMAAGLPGTSGVASLARRVGPQDAVPAHPAGPGRAGCLDVRARTRSYPLFPGRRNARITSAAVRLRLITDHARRPRLDARRWEERVASHVLRHAAATSLQGRGVASDAASGVWRESGAVRDAGWDPPGARVGRQRKTPGQGGRRVPIAPSVTMSHQVRVPQARQRVSRACASATQVPRVGPVLNGATSARQVCGPCNPAARPLAAVRAAGRGRGPETPPPGSP